MRDNMKGVESFEPTRLYIRRRRSSGPSLVAGDGEAIRAIQKDLGRIGADVKPTGRLDEATVLAINGVFNGWDDGPKAMTTGKLTAAQISKNATVVAKYLHKAVAQMTTFANANE